MGGQGSSCHTNDELIDLQKNECFIRTSNVERVFRIVDRAHYYLKDHKDHAYSDAAWKFGTLHLSAPCIYSKAMEAFEFEKGLSFLNLGSGTGYLSTLVGFMLGPYGINHGIELHEENVTYAKEKLDTFKQICKNFDDIEFCEPQFVIGNCLDLPPETRLYDRVYCGAACPQEQKETLQKMLKINGILVVPVDDQLLKVQRLDETTFTSTPLMSVSFASLVLPFETEKNKALTENTHLPEVQPLSLQFICSVVTREAIRKNFDFKLPTPIEGSPRARHNIFSNRSAQPNTPDLFHPFKILFNESDYDGSSSESDDENNAYRQQRTLHLRRNIASMGLDHELNPSDIDSDFSEIEDNIGNKDRTPQNTQNRNNQMSSETSSFNEFDENGFSNLNSEDGVIADDEADPDDEIAIRQSNKGKLSLRGDLVEKNSNSCNGSYNDASTSTANFDSGSTSSLRKKADCTQSNAELSRNSITASQPLPVKSSYSTSADTSETSGFGSLIEDLQPPSISNSFDGSISDSSSSENETSDKESRKGVKPLLSTLLKRKINVNKSKLTSGLTSDEEDESMNQATKQIKISNNHLIETNEDEYDASHSDVNRVTKSSDDENIDKECKHPRDQLFSIFLKQKVETLPIPHSVKSYLLHYRKV